MRAARIAAVATAALLATVAPAVPAAAVDVAWEGPTVSLAWDGSARASAERSFVGVPVTVPGDRARRAVSVRNDGPTGGTLRAWVTQVELLDADPGSSDGFYDDLRLDWVTASQDDGSSFRELDVAGDTLIAQTHLAQGATTRLEVAYELPVDATTGNRSVVGERAASFVVRFQISGDTTGPAPSAAPSTGTGAGTDPRPAADAAVAGARDDAGQLALTGLDVLRAGLVAVVGMGVGTLLLGVARRRRGVHHLTGDSSTPSAR
ncbi:hypothetical protein [Cellulomonas xiejunii]|uniref:Peptidase n=1 Tax=Cellulomonas xiejunii TaxID=2968083 RepID=A0ABY5KJW1_9CELL|nr:hypothetical protein [Cellulomonas xiejunii]MCC2320472.1 hypothetical protein [Cellulomonas xiejunii]UUI70767.1 hypothetical protein NP048_13310 [Cellulomonas xiejunii]